MAVLEQSQSGDRDEEHEGATQPTASPRTHEWTVRVSIFETEDDTDARAVLVAGSPEHLRASGQSQRAPQDRVVPEIGDEVAVARALRHLADLLMSTAESDISSVTGKDAQVRRT